MKIKQDVGEAFNIEIKIGSLFLEAASLAAFRCPQTNVMSKISIA